MKLTFSTFVADLSLTLDAVNLYQSGEFRRAINHIQAVLDLEPSNWDARLMLAVCFFKTGQHGAAIRAFQVIADKAACPDIRQKALEGLKVCSAKLERAFDHPAAPAEFGSHVEKIGAHKSIQLSWI